MDETGLTSSGIKALIVSAVLAIVVIVAILLYLDYRRDKD